MSPLAGMCEARLQTPVTDALDQRDGDDVQQRGEAEGLKGAEGLGFHLARGVRQFGEADGHAILAGAASLGIGYAFEDFCWKPSLILRADAISGGDGEGTVHTFNPLFQANNYFNEGGFISPSNLYNLNPLLVLKPRDNLTVNLGVNFQWRFDAEDSVYGAPLQVLGGPAPDGQTYLGTALNLSVEWNPFPATTLFLGYTHHDAGPSLTSIGGTDVDYLQLSVRQEF